jgi:dihydrofolate reductase
MPRIRYQVAASLDGYIADPDGGYGWIVDDPTIDFEVLFAQFDTFVMGRATYELTTGMSDPPFPAGSRIFVYSRTMRQADHPGITVVPDVSAESVERLRAGARKDIWLFGGGKLFQGFLQGGFVDTVEIAIIPVLLGGGVPLLMPPAPTTSLQLTGHRVYPSGIVWLDYDVRR